MSDPIVPVGGTTGGVTLPVQPSVPGAPVQKAAPTNPGGTSVSNQAPSHTAAAQQGASHAASPAVVQSAVAQVQAYLKSHSAEVQFSEDKASGHTVFKVVNSVTHEVIRQVPSEEILEMARKLKALDEGTTGILIDQQT